MTGVGEWLGFAGVLQRVGDVVKVLLWPLEHLTMYLEQHPGHRFILDLLILRMEEAVKIRFWAVKRVPKTAQEVFFFSLHQGHGIWEEAEVGVASVSLTSSSPLASYTVGPHDVALVPL